MMNTTESRDFSNNPMVVISSAASLPRAVTGRGFVSAPYAPEIGIISKPGRAMAATHAKATREKCAGISVILLAKPAFLFHVNRGGNGHFQVPLEIGICCRNVDAVVDRHISILFFQSIVPEPHVHTFMRSSDIFVERSSNGA